MEVQANKSFFKSLKRIGSLGEKFKKVRLWCIYYIFNKDFNKLHKALMKSYPWDWTFLYDLEKAKIEEMCKYHEKHQRFEGWEYVVRDMKLCMKLIDIFTGKISLFHYDGDFVFEPIEGTDNFKMTTTDDFKYNCDVYVNTKNIDRFCENENQRKYFLEYPDNLYVKKAKNLYHKIRMERDEMWWD